MLLVLTVQFAHSGPFAGSMAPPESLGRFPTLDEAVAKSDAYLEACKMFRSAKESIRVWVLDLETDEVVHDAELAHEDPKPIGPHSIIEMMTGRPI